MDEAVLHRERLLAGAEYDDRNALPELCSSLGTAVPKLFLSPRSLASTAAPAAAMCVVYASSVSGFSSTFSAGRVINDDLP
jgi:hypothetical protein